MTRRINKFITPFIIVPLITGGLVSFVVLFYQGSDTEVIGVYKPAFSQSISKTIGARNIRLAAEAILIAASILGIAFLIRKRFAETSDAEVREQNRLVRNKSPPAFA